MAQFRANCSCGWTLNRDRRAANLPTENNRRITESAADAHQFAHEVFDDDGHETSAVEEVEV